MAVRISRRILARHVADQMIAGSDKIIAQLAAFLIETHRVSESALIVRDIENMLAQSGIVVADITSAHNLSEELLKVLTSNISESLGAKEVHLRKQIDTSLIGGVRIRTPEAEYDNTVRRQLAKLQAMKV